MLLTQGAIRGPWIHEEQRLTYCVNVGRSQDDYVYPSDGDPYNQAEPLSVEEMIEDLLGIAGL